MSPCSGSANMMVRTGRNEWALYVGGAGDGAGGGRGWGYDVR